MTTSDPDRLLRLNDMRGAVYSYLMDCERDMMEISKLLKS